VGSIVNIEFDIIGKYLSRMMQFSWFFHRRLHRWLLKMKKRFFVEIRNYLHRLLNKKRICAICG